MTVRDRSDARADYDQALHHALRARATELAASIAADAVETALATAERRWGDVAQLAAALEGRRRPERRRWILAEIASEREDRKPDDD